MRTLHSVVLLWAFCFLSITRPLWGGDVPAKESPEPFAEVLDSFSVAKRGDILCVPLTLTNHEGSVLFMIDTGAEATVFDVSLEPALGQSKGKVRVGGPAGFVSCDVFAAPRANIGRIPFEGVSSILTLDLSAVRRASGHDIKGVLGMDFLRRHMFQVDFDLGKMCFLRDSKPDPNRYGKPIQVFFFGGNTPSVTGAASLKEIDRFIVDTGATITGGVEFKLFDKLIAQGELIGLTDSRILTVSGATNQSIGRADLLAVKAFTISKPVVNRTDANYLGLGFWSRFLVTFDFPRKTIYLKKGARFEDPDVYNWSGVFVVRDEDRVKVLSVRDGSPAAIAEIVPGDVLVKIADASIEGASLYEVRRLLMLDQAGLKLQIHRDGVHLTMQLKAKSEAIQSTSAKSNDDE